MIYKCLICGGIKIRDMKTYEAKTRVMRGRSLVTCCFCGGKQVNPMISLKELQVYNKDYWERIGIWSNSQKEEKTFWKQKVLAKERAKYLLANSLDVRKVLGIGSGRGFLFDELRKKYPRAKYSSVEHDKKMRNVLLKKKVKVYNDWREAGKGKYDIIICSHVLEHMIDPKAFLIWAKNGLTKKGIIFIDVPSNDDQFRKIHEPHLFVFNKKVIRILMLIIGLRIIDMYNYGRKNVNIQKEVFGGVVILRKLYWYIRFFFNRKKALKDYYQINKKGSSRCWLRVLLEEKK